MGRKQAIIELVKLNHNIKRWRKIELRKRRRNSEKAIINEYYLTDCEKKAIDIFFVENTKKKVDYFWHLKYKVVSGNFNYRCFPEIYYNADLKLKMNDKRYVYAYSDKYVLSKIIQGSRLNILVPKTLVCNNNGIFLDGSDQVISKEKAIELLSHYDSFFIKKTTDSYGGDGCGKYSKLTTDIIYDAFKKYGDNFLVQEIIRNQNDIKALNSSTLNTFRLITYIIDGKVYTTPIVLRIGRIYSDLDNAHQGGMFVGVSDEGEIVTDAKNVYGQTFARHPDTGIVFKGYHINNVPLVKESAIKLASLIPQTKLVDWDLALNENGEVVCIEANIDTGSIWLMQMTHGTPVFGEQTEQMLRMVRNINFIKDLIKIIKNK